MKSKRAATRAAQIFLFPIVLSLVFLSRAFSQQPQVQLRTVRQVVDGDTLVLENGEKIRLIGVDTPETHHPQKPVEYFGEEATAFTRNLVEGKRVLMETDPVNAHLGHKDKYGRTIAYVWTEQGIFVNAEIVEQGYGHAYTRYPFRYLNEFRALESRARGQGAGLWGSSGKSTNLPRSSNGPVKSSREFNDGTPVDYTANGKPVYRGPRGGLYHWSESGNKVYHARPASATSGLVAGTTSTGKTLYQGPRGGIYHYSSGGNKVYHSRSGSSGQGKR